MQMSGGEIDDDGDALEYDGPMHDDPFKFYNIVRQPDSVPGKKKPDPTIQCQFCNKEFVAGKTRARKHFTGGKDAGVTKCKKVPPVIVRHFGAKENLKSIDRATQDQAAALDRATTSCSDHVNQSSNDPAVNLRQTTIVEGFKKMDKSGVDAEVARTFYMHGLPFHLVRSKQFLRMCKAIGQYGSSYTPPGYNQLRVDGLKAERVRVEGQVQALEHGIKRTGCTITGDGWADACSRPLVNVLKVVLLFWFVMSIFSLSHI
jgi:hypothetical protein